VAGVTVTGQARKSRYILLLHLAGAQVYEDDYYYYEGDAAQGSNRGPAATVTSSRRRPAQSDYYYYDYEEPVVKQTAQRRPQAASQTAADEDSDYDLTELVRAWKEYIKEKKRGSGRRGGGGRRKGGRRRPALREPIVEYECPPRDESYRIPDPAQCDKFEECNIKGEKKVLLCPDGLVFDIKSEHCDYPAKVNCSGRPDLREWLQRSRWPCWCAL